MIAISQISEAKEIKSYKDIRDYNVVRQTKRNSCGAAALATILKYKLHIDYVDEKFILSKLNNPNQEASFLDLKDVANSLGIDAFGISLKMRDLLRIKKPVIAYVNNIINEDHFLIINGFNGNNVYISDPAFGNYSLTINEFKKIWEVNGYGSILFLEKNNSDRIITEKNSHRINFGR